MLGCWRTSPLSAAGLRSRSKAGSTRWKRPTAAQPSQATRCWRSCPAAAAAWAATGLRQEARGSWRLWRKRCRWTERRAAWRAGLS
eukprot:scaffold61893_cov51-Phaeocystis_antarctica.AAC.6